jgi:hypothetical protein
MFSEEEMKMNLEYFIHRKVLSAAVVWIGLTILTGGLVTGCSYSTESGPTASETSGKLIHSSGCKGQLSAYAIEKTPTTTDCIEYSYDDTNAVLHLAHINSGFNCCPGSVTADIEVGENIIRIQEKESLDQGGCHCLCLFDLHYQITKLPPGEYRIIISQLYLREGDAMLQFPINLLTSPSGRYCVDRDHYPWGI